MMVNVRLIPYSSRLTIAFIVFLFCPSQASVWVSDEPLVDARISGLRGTKTALPVPPLPHGSETQTLREDPDKGTGGFIPDWPEHKHGKRARDKLHFSATVPKLDMGKGVSSRTSSLFRKTRRSAEPIQRLAPGNCDSWDLAMTRVAALSCGNLKVWKGLKADKG